MRETAEIITFPDIFILCLGSSFLQDNGGKENYRLITPPLGMLGRLLLRCW